MRNRKAPSGTSKKFTPPQLARVWQVAPATVLGLIRSGELTAFNIADPTAKRPRYLIDDEDRKAFEDSRRVVPHAKPAKRTRRATEGKEFF